MNLSELTGTTGLLLVTILCGSHLGNGLTIRNLRRKQLYIKIIDIVEEPLYNVDVLLSIALEYGLAELLVVVNDNGRIL